MIIHDFAGLTGHTLRPLVSGDVPRFIELGMKTCAFMHGRAEVSPERLRRNFAAFVREYAFDSGSQIFVVEDPGGTIMAQLWLHVTQNRFNGLSEMWIWDITVHKSFQKRGIGRYLLEFSKIRAKGEDCQELWLLVSSKNNNARKLYESGGLDYGGHLMSVRFADERHYDEGRLAVNGARLRPLRPSDVSALYELWEKGDLPFRLEGRDRPDRLAKHLSGALPGGWGAEVDNRLVAAVLVSFDGRKGWIERLVTLPEHRRAGLGKVIVTAAMNSLREAGALVIAALIESENLPSRRLFEACGFVDSPALRYYSFRENSGD